MITLTENEIRIVLASAIEDPKICRVYFNYDPNYFYYFPIAVSKDLFIGANEDDFSIDGYTIRRIKDVISVRIKDDKCLEIDIAEGLLDEINLPEIDITDWHSAFRALKAIGENIIIEKESSIADDCQFAIGRIAEVHGDFLLLREFDAEGNWLYDNTIITFSAITSVTINSRYVRVFSKYLPTCPEE